ncbi:MAG: Glu-tRNA(Gln) amidotransferase subunit GatD [Nanoarchaeota archaeon]|nr:Glu-tRNA(Gln) amidotransferase subunit GatD [Nanoarchaeota archaeon]
MNKHVKIQYGDEELVGILIQESPNVVLKLSSGYNLVLSKKKVKKIEVLPKSASDAKQSDAKQAPQVQTKPKTSKKVSILHTGGTIACKVDYTTGAVIAQFEPEELLQLYPELGELAHFSCKVVTNCQSEMLRFPHYNLLADGIMNEIKEGADAIIITHGTDTMHYSSAAISFMMENLPVPVILVGSQRSSDRPSSDARINLVCAIYFATHTKWNGVGICMHENKEDNTCVLLPGLRSRKMHTTRRDAFKAIGSEPIARIDYDNKKIEYITPLTEIETKGEFGVKKFNENLKVGIFKARNHMFADELLAYKKYDGLVLESFAIGHMPIHKIDKYTSENEKIFAAIKTLTKKMPVVATSQCIYGRMEMNVYTPGRELLEAGVLGNYADMTTETAYIKLAWLLSNYSKEETSKLISKNLRGEITTRTEGDYEHGF